MTSDPIQLTGLLILSSARAAFGYAANERLRLAVVLGSFGPHATNMAFAVVGCGGTLGPAGKGKFDPGWTL